MGGAAEDEAEAFLLSFRRRDEPTAGSRWCRRLVLGETSSLVEGIGIRNHFDTAIGHPDLIRDARFPLREADHRPEPRRGSSRLRL
jgi:hypothetical protein